MKPARPDNKLHAAQAACAAGEDTQAQALSREVLRRDPKSGPALTLLAEVAFRQGGYERATGFARRALATGHSLARHVLGCALSKSGQLDEALAALRRAHRDSPVDARIEYNLGIVELTAGEWQEGFRHFEARWRIRTPPPYVQPWAAQWCGEPLDGKRVFVFAEQGFGDTIQFARYIPALLSHGAAVSLAVQPALARLFSSVAGVDLLKPGDRVPAFDFHVPVMSLALAFGTLPSSVPPPLDLGPVADPRRDGTPRRRRIGLCWAGNRRDPEDWDRSLPIDVLGDLIAILADCELVSLQVDGDADLARCRGGAGVTPVREGIVDFADTAAIIAGLDIVLTVDTAVAHLAGSLGKPAWLLLWTGCDWRWLRTGDATPWYPSLRLFRQERRGDWVGPLSAIAAALSAVERPMP